MLQMSKDHTPTILKLLDVLRNKELAMYEPYNATAYSNVIKNINSLGIPIYTIDDLKSVKGIGERIRKQLKEYFESGSIQDMNNSSVHVPKLPTEETKECWIHYSNDNVSVNKEVNKQKLSEVKDIDNQKNSQTVVAIIKTCDSMNQTSTKIKEFSCEEDYKKFISEPKNLINKNFKTLDISHFTKSQFQSICNQGKWMLFYNKSKIDSAWIKCKSLCDAGELGFTQMKVSTNYKNPRASSTDYVIILYTDGDSDYILNVGENIVNKLDYNNKTGKIYFKTDMQSILGTRATGEKQNHTLSVKCGFLGNKYSFIDV
jgi:hypothetical protein